MATKIDIYFQTDNIFLVFSILLMLFQPMNDSRGNPCESVRLLNYAISLGIQSGHLHNHVGLTENFDQSENEEFLVNDSP